MIDYKKKYNEALERARKIHNEILNNELLGFPDQIREIFPELKDGEDERHRKWILEYLYDGLRKADEQFKDHFKSAIDWLEKQKEIQFGVPGLYYYDGEKVHYYGSPATEEKIEKQDVDFSTNDTSKK